MPIVLFARHGENDYVKKGRLAGRLPEVHLNENGRRQAAALAENLAGSPITAIFSSPLERAVETATPIAERLNLPVTISPGLIEVDCGQWQGESLKKLSRLKIWSQVQHSPALFRFPEGETFRDAQLRIVNDVMVLVNQHDPKDVLLCVSHSDPIKLAVAYFMGLPLDRFQSLHVSPGSLSALAINGSSVNVLALNTYSLPIQPKP